MTINNLSETNTDIDMKTLLDQYDYKRPKRGQFIDAEIMQVEDNHILVDLGAKIDAVIPSRELRNTDQELLEDLSEGDIVPVYILHPPSMLEKPTVSLQRGVEKRDWEQAKKLLREREIIQLKVIDKNKGGLLIKFGNLEGFLPASLLPTIARAQSKQDAEKIKSNLVGEQLYLSIIEVDKKKRRLIFSARENREQIKQRIFSDIEHGDVRTGIVINLVDFGAFIDLFGVDGLLHISELDWTRIDHPSEVLSSGDKIEVKILDIDATTERIGLSRKALINPINVFDNSEDIEK